MNDTCTRCGHDERSHRKLTREKILCQSDNCFCDCDGFTTKKQEPLATVHVTDVKDADAYIVLMKDGEIVAGVYRCPTCEGKGQKWGHRCGYDYCKHHGETMYPCRSCGGSGLVSETVYQRIIKHMNDAK